jgi:hypothetical protein
MARSRGTGVRGKRAHQGILKTIRPSKEAAELAALLGRSYDWPALQDAFRPDRKYIPYAHINQVVKAELKKHKLFGPKREAKRVEIREELISASRRQRERLRHQGWDPHHLVEEYVRHHRVRVQGLPVEHRPDAAKEMLSAYLHRFCASDEPLQRLRGLSAAEVEKRKAEVAAKQRQQFIDMKMREAGLKSAPRRPMTKMLFPKSAADPIGAFEHYLKMFTSAHQTALAIDPGLAQLPAKEIAKIVLSNTPLVRPDDEMWHSKRAAFIRSDYDTKDTDWKE